MLDKATCPYSTVSSDTFYRSNNHCLNNILIDGFSIGIVCHTVCVCPSNTAPQQCSHARKVGSADKSDVGTPADGCMHRWEDALFGECHVGLEGIHA